MRALLALLIAIFLPSASLAASVEGMAIHSTVQGEGETIIFVHGWTCDESSWKAQLPAFLDNYRTVTLDLPGHGASETPASEENFSMELFVDAVEAVRNEIGAPRVALVGHSMGAAVIRAYALKYPEHVAGLVAVDGHLDQRAWTKFEPPSERVTRATRAALIEGMFVDKTSPELRNQIRNMMLGTSALTAQGAFNAMASPSNQSDQVIMSPALTIWAEDGRPDADFDTRDLIPSWEETRIEGSGHFLMMERPEEFNALLRKFISDRAKF